MLVTLRGQRDLNHNVIYFDSRFNLCWYPGNVSWFKLGISVWTLLGLHESAVYKIIQIVRTLWLAIKPFYMNVCKHGFHTESSHGVLPAIYLAVTQFL